MPVLESHGAYRLGNDRHGYDKILLLGEDQPQSEDPAHALWPFLPNSAGERLMKNICGLTPEMYLGLWRGNLCYPGWNRDQAIIQFFRFISSDVPWDKIIMCGRRVASIYQGVFAPYRIDPFVIEHHGLRMGADREFHFLSLPHPSGRCIRVE